MIEQYLRELRRALGLWPNPRLVAETEQHLREAAAELGEEEAVRRFGPPEDVVRPYRAGLAWLFAGAAVLATLAFPVLSYPIVENSLPPAPWPSGEKPDYLEWKQNAVLVLFAIAAFAALIAVAAWKRGGRVRLVALAVATVALLGMAALDAVLGVQWADAVPGTPTWLGSVWALQCVLALLTAALTGRAAVLSHQ